MNPVLASGLAAAGGLAAGPLLAGWTLGLAEQDPRWWRPRRTSARRCATVAVLAGLLTAAAVHAQPISGWLLLAVGGTVLAVVDVQTHRLPSALLHPLAAAIATALVTTAVLADDAAGLARAAAAAAVVGAAWLLAGLAAPAAVGLGDIRLCALTAGLLGWAGWWPVWLGQAGAWLLALPLAVALTLAQHRRLSARMPLPVGPAIVAAALAATWL